MTDICLRTIKMTIFLNSLRVKSNRFWTIIIFISSNKRHSFMLSSKINMFQGRPLDDSISLRTFGANITHLIID